jgi:hypothetical protein
MSQCKHIISMLSDYHEGSLSAKAHQEVAEHVAACAECAKEDRDLRRTVTLLSNLPMPEPRLDLWEEFSAKMAEVEAEQRLSFFGRIERYWHHALSSLAEGMVLYTHVVARRTLENMGRFLVRDPFQVSE